jgi:triacylglycerol lipase
MKKEDLVVVLVHGFRDSSNGGLKILKDSLTNAGYSCILPDLHPNDGSHGLEPLAEQLKKTIEEQSHPNKKLVVVGSSMGALISRYFLQFLEGHQKTVAFFSVCGPHHGTILAFFKRNKGVRQMRPFSRFLQSLKKTRRTIEKIPTVSYWKSYDKMIIPWNSCWLGIGEKVKIKSPLHRTVVREVALHKDILSRLEKITLEGIGGHKNSLT